MSDQYVFELQFKGKPDGSDYRENQFVIIDGTSMADFSRLKEDLGMCIPEPFTVQYIDDEDDVISIDTEEEFREFAKIAKKRSARGMLLRLILNSNLPMDHREFVPSPVYVNSTLKKARFSPGPGEENLLFGGFPLRRKISEGLRDLMQPHTSSGLSFSRSHRNQRHRLQEFKDKIKAELKNEILSELKEMGPGAQAETASVDVGNSEHATGTSKESGQMEEELKEAEYEEDSDGNMFLVYVPEKNSRKTKLMHYQKKLEKKEKLVEAKIDQRLEKLEMKRKKLMEKYSHHKTLARKPAVDAKVSLPLIISAIATKESSVMSKRVTATKVFTHVWTIVNDGTVPLNNVELRHTWSSPGLEPQEADVNLVPLLPGQQCTLAVKFKAPCWTQNSSFISYWHFFRLDDARWQEFGHYVSVTGSTKPMKSTPHDFVDSKAFESNKKPKHEEKNKSVVSFMEAVDAVAAVAKPPREPQEEKVLNVWEMLASGDIAADMARQAARARLLAKPSASGSNTSPKPSEGDKLNNCGLEEAAAGVQQLNLIDSESDTDANMEINDETDRGFVMVNMTPEDTGKQETMQEGKPEPPTATTTEEEAQPQKQPMSFPRLDPNVTYPVFPPPPPRVSNPPVYMPQHAQMIPHNVYNYPIFPPPVNYPQIPTYPPLTNIFHHPAPGMPIPLSTQPPFVPVTHPYNPFSTRQTVNSAATPTDKPAETEQPAQEMNTAENSAANAQTEEATRPEQPQQQQQYPQQQQQYPQQQQQYPQQTEATPQTDEQNKNPDQVQILPQALVDGAINVAATAYSTAWNALNNLRPKEGEASEFDPVFENNMAMLVEMGFNNLERNARLLKRFNNDISKVIGIICSTGGCHNLDID